MTEKRPVGEDDLREVDGGRSDVSSDPRDGSGPVPKTGQDGRDAQWPLTPPKGAEGGVA